MTNTSFKLIFAALAATAALTGCTKEITPGKADTDPKAPAAEGTRVIAVSFAPQTKTSFSETAGGIAPYFVKGDKIVLCSDIENPTDDNTETCTVTEQCTITTKLTGALTAYYPADYVEKGEKLGLCIPANQSGEFKDANFVATIIADGATSATFYNVIALFRITPPTGTKKLTVKSLCEIGSDGQRSGDRRSINDEGETDQKRCSVVVGDGTTNIESPCYVALSPGVNLSDLSFEATSDAEGATGYIKGITTSAIAAKAGTGVAVGSEAYNTCNTVAEGSAYTIDENNWHGYVTVAGRKWATMNIGATSETDAGEYFMWSDVRGHKYENSQWTNFPETNPDESRYNSEFWNSSKCFSGENIPFVLTQEWEELFEGYGSWKYTCSKYNDDGTNHLLSLSDDAAYVNWGGAWRMPKGAEYESLITMYEWKKIDGIYGMVYGTSPYTVFFPASGLGQGTELKFSSEPTIWARYWTSESTGTRGGDYNLILGYDGEAMGATPETNLGYGFPRCHGCNVRAIVDDPDFIATED